MLDNSTK